MIITRFSSLCVLSICRLSSSGEVNHTSNTHTLMKNSYLFFPSIVLCQCDFLLNCVQLCVSHLATASLEFSVSAPPCAAPPTFPQLPKREQHRCDKSDNNRVRQTFILENSTAFSSSVLSPCIRLSLCSNCCNWKSYTSKQTCLAPQVYHKFISVDLIVEEFLLLQRLFI